MFAHHKVVQDAVPEELKKKQVPHIRIHGCTSWPTQRACASRSSYREARSSRVSITFPSAHLVMFAEIFGSPVVLIRGVPRTGAPQGTAKLRGHPLPGGKRHDCPLPLTLTQEKVTVLGELGF